MRGPAVLLLLTFWLCLLPGRAAFAAPADPAGQTGRQPDEQTAERIVPDLPSSLDVDPPAGWQPVNSPDEEAVRACRRYERTDGLLRLTVCPAAELPENHETQGWRSLEDAGIRSDAQTFRLLARSRNGTGAGSFLLTADSPVGTLHRQEASAMLAAFAGTFAIPEALQIPPGVPSRYLGRFAPEGRTKTEELGCTAYFRTVHTGRTREKLLVVILPYSQAWLPQEDIFAALKPLWGELLPAGRHWMVDDDHHLALSRDGRALCLLSCLSGHPPGEKEEIRQAMQDLADFVW